MVIKKNSETYLNFRMLIVTGRGTYMDCIEDHFEAMDNIEKYHEEAKEENITLDI